MKFALALSIAAAATGHAFSINRQTAHDLELLADNDGLLVRGEPVIEARGASSSKCGSQNGSTFCRKERLEGNKLIGEATLKRITGQMNMGPVPMMSMPPSVPKGTMMANSAGEVIIGQSVVGKATMGKKFQYIIEYQASKMMFTMNGSKAVEVKM